MFPCPGSFKIAKADRYSASGSFFFVTVSTGLGDVLAEATRLGLGEAVAISAETGVLDCKKPPCSSIYHRSSSRLYYTSTDYEANPMRARNRFNRNSMHKHPERRIVSRD